MNTPEDQNKKDIEILKALYHGNHLEPAELKRAIELLHLLQTAARERQRSQIFNFPESQLLPIELNKEVLREGKEGEQG